MRTVFCLASLVVEDLDRSCYCVGGMTTNDLVGAALTAAELGNRDSLSETEVATN